MTDFLDRRIQHLAAVHQIPETTLCNIFASFIEALHEMEFKQPHDEPSPTLEQIYWTLGDEAAWHYFGLASEILDDRFSEYVSDVRSLWNETALRLDGRMKRFNAKAELWSRELRNGTGDSKGKGHVGDDI